MYIKDHDCVYKDQSMKLKLIFGVDFYASDIFFHSLFYSYNTISFWTLFHFSIFPHSSSLLPRLFLILPKKIWAYKKNVFSYILRTYVSMYGKNQFCKLCWVSARAVCVISLSLFISMRGEILFSWREKFAVHNIAEMKKC